ncbi:D-glycero-beta-D-manno-heptose 1,7-bisphosphate 7-phosphatase [Corallincola platygyrae]|uniref:D,D-heptose 1,7-bisphosphate phosphatase n=1 Tax=Corallincola platygyrae TaxID=1193278 RepID=A0ABW4XPT0_9GAMM
MQKAVFLDRDGVINVDHGYVHEIASFEFVEGVLDAARNLYQQGYLLVVVTNQSGIARGYYDESQFHQLTEWMKSEFQKAGAPLTAVYCCPHHPKGEIAKYAIECQCRKPEPGMLKRAADEHNISLGSSYMVGDKADDMRAAIAAGLKGQFLVRTGKSVTKEGAELASEVVDSLADVPSAISKAQ